VVGRFLQFLIFFLQFLGKVRLGYRQGGRALAARQARGPSAAAFINSGGYFP
jgi:hypothetical protein